MEQKKFKAGVVQFDIIKGDITANMKVVMENLLLLAAQEVRLAVLPELFSCGFDNVDIKVHAGRSQKILDELSKFASDHNMAVAGTLPEASKDRIFNTLYFIDVDGKIKGSYRKLHLFPLTGEHLYYAAGDRVVTIDTSLGRIGLMICYDLRFPEQARQLFLQDADIIVVPAQWPEPRIAHLQILARARAVENQLYMICANRTGTDQDLVFSGMSMIIDPMGEILTIADDSDTTAVACIDPAGVIRARNLIPCRTDRRKDIYG